MTEQAFRPGQVAEALANLARLADDLTALGLHVEIDVRVTITERDERPTVENGRRPLL